MHDFLLFGNCQAKFREKYCPPPEIEAPKARSGMGIGKGYPSVVSATSGIRDKKNKLISESLVVTGALKCGTGMKRGVNRG